MMGGGGRNWLTALATGLLALAVLAAPALSQQQPEKPQEPEGKRAEKPAGVLPIDLVVDGSKKLTWTPEALTRLGTDKWLDARGKKGVRAIELWRLLSDGGVSKDIVKEVRISNPVKTLTFKGEELAKVDHFVMRSALKPGRPWELASSDPSTETRRRRPSLARVRQIEVITAK